MTPSSNTFLIVGYLRSLTVGYYLNDDVVDDDGHDYHEMIDIGHQFAPQTLY